MIGIHNRNIWIVLPNAKRQFYTFYIDNATQWCVMLCNDENNLGFSFVGLQQLGEVAG
jgi:hypothetical protein